MYDLAEGMSSVLVRMVPKTQSQFTAADLTRSPIIPSTSTTTDLSYLVSLPLATQPLSFKYQNPAFSNGNTVYIVMSIGSGSLTEGTQASILANYTFSFAYRADTGGSYTLLHSTSDYWRFWVAKAGFTDKQQIFPDEHGVFTMPYDVGFLMISCSVTGMGSLSNRGYVSIGMVGRPSVMVDVLETSMERIINDQTETLMNTEGSSSVFDDVAGQGQQISQNMNFVQQTGQFVTGAFDAVANSEEVSTVTFPGISLMGFTIQPTNVNMLQYIDSELLELIRTGVTMVVFLAWFSGLRAMYHRIFLGQTQIEVVDE